MITLKVSTTFKVTFCNVPMLPSINGIYKRITWGRNKFFINNNVTYSTYYSKAYSFDRDLKPYLIIDDIFEPFDLTKPIIIEELFINNALPLELKKLEEILESFLKEDIAVDTAKTIKELLKNVKELQTPAK